jgi:hypothetical protein
LQAASRSIAFAGYACAGEALLAFRHPGFTNAIKQFEPSDLRGLLP